ncbi:MAG: DUF2442 domain-containing protein [Propionibacteriaceae bacterium]|jgi:hypothetical protein|nr:DUF2442 domain-containing protein [Propionibacteriaceae bacterium]
MATAYWPEIAQALPGPDFTVFAYFTDGTVRSYDAKPLLARGGVFAPLRDEGTFVSTVTVSNGTIAWTITNDHNPATVLDVDPFSVYASQVVPDPLQATRPTD